MGAVLNEELGRALRDWILFAIGCIVIVILTAKWALDGEAPDPYLGGIALLLVGVGNEILKRGA